MREKNVSLKDLQNFAYKEGKDYGGMFVEWMDWIIDIFDANRFIDGTFESNFAEKTKENELFTALLLTWLNDNTKAQEDGRLIDWFGNQYEESIKSKSKADALGQFYTPMSICEMMAKINAHKMCNADTATCDDCACGSGRLLIAMEQELRKQYGVSNRRYYTAADIDHMSVKMCALNLMIAGVCGQVMCRDTLRMETWYGYEINEVRYPFPTPMYSIRRITPEEAERLTAMRLKRREKQEDKIAVTTDDNGQVNIDFDNL